METQEKQAHAEKNHVPPLDNEQRGMLSKIASAVRVLSMDAVQKANSGHPGLPLGCAEIGAYLYGMALNQNPKNPKWLNRDRFILSAGHGSMWLYALLHLSGYKVSIEDIKRFRQLHSNTPGHPECHETDGVEATTGPLGQGVGNACGHALGLKLLAAKFNTEKHKLFDSKVYCLAGDGDMMEGVSSEASSLTGHLQLDNLIIIYDANNVSLDGPLSDCCSENTKERYRAYGFEVFEMNGNDINDVHKTMTLAKQGQTKPRIIIAHTIIGKGSPNKAGTSKVHGSPLGPEEVKLTKEALGLSQEPFFVNQAVYDYFSKKQKEDQLLEEEWNRTFDSWKNENPDLYNDFIKMQEKILPEDLEEKITKIEIKNPIAGRNASNTVIQELCRIMPEIYGGSADLSCSDMTWIKDSGVVKPGSFKGRNIKYGVREFGMATMATGLSETGMIIPYIGTFLTFSDYMRNAIRLAALSKIHVIYQFTHDSIFLGEDGPTHQSIEHYAALRAMLNLHFIRPGDANEVKMAWLAAIYYKGPTALSLSRQNLPELKETRVPYVHGMGRGAYILLKETRKPDFTLVATGSELSLALDVAKELEKLGKSVRLISMPCWEIFEKQDAAYKESIFGGDIGKRVSIEAGVEMGWHKYIGLDGIAIAMDTYGLSAPASDLAEEFGFTVPSILDRIL